MGIEGLSEDTIVLSFTPIAWDWSGEIVSPRNPFEHFALSYLYPVAYDAGEVTLQESGSLFDAVRMTRGCQAYDGGGIVRAVVREKDVGRKVKRDCPWGKKPPPGAEQPQGVREVVEVGADGS